MNAQAKVQPALSADIIARLPQAIAIVTQCQCASRRILGWHVARAQSPLTSQGERQVPKLVSLMKALPHDVTYHSEFRSAVRIVQELEWDTKPRAELNEIDFGSPEYDFEGIDDCYSMKEYARAFPGRHPHDPSIPMGESIEQAQQRAVEFLAELCESTARGVCLITHNFRALCLKHVLTGIDPSLYRDWTAILPYDASVTVFTKENGLFVVGATHMVTV